MSIFSQIVQRPERQGAGAAFMEAAAKAKEQKRQEAFLKLRETQTAINMANARQAEMSGILDAAKGLPVDRKKDYLLKSAQLLSQKYGPNNTMASRLMSLAKSQPTRLELLKNLSEDNIAKQNPEEMNQIINSAANDPLSNEQVSLGEKVMKFKDNRELEMLKETEKIKRASDLEAKKEARAAGIVDGDKGSTFFTPKSLKPVKTAGQLNSVIQEMFMQREVKSRAGNYDKELSDQNFENSLRTIIGSSLTDLRNKSVALKAGGNSDKDMREFLISRGMSEAVVNSLPKSGLEARFDTQLRLYQQDLLEMDTINEAFVNGLEAGLKNIEDAIREGLIKKDSSQHTALLNRVKQIANRK